MDGQRQPNPASWEASNPAATFTRHPRVRRLPSQHDCIVGQALDKRTWRTEITAALEMATAPRERRAPNRVAAPVRTALRTPCRAGHRQPALRVRALLPRLPAVTGTQPTTRDLAKSPPAITGAFPEDRTRRNREQRRSGFSESLGGYRLEYP